MAKGNKAAEFNKTYLAMGGLAVLVLILINSEYGVSNKIKEAFKKADPIIQVTPTPIPYNPKEISMAFDEKTRILSTNQITHFEEPNRTIKFSMKVLPGWTVKQAVQTEGSYRFEVTNGEYVLSGSYGYPREGAVCYYPGDKVPEPRTGYEMVLDNYTTVNTAFGTLRVARSLENYTSSKATRFVVCQQSSNEWIVGTPIDGIGISGPENYSQAKINEMIEMIKSIQVR